MCAHALHELLYHRWWIFIDVSYDRDADKTAQWNTARVMKPLRCPPALLWQVAFFFPERNAGNERAGATFERWTIDARDCTHRLHRSIVTVAISILATHKTNCRPKRSFREREIATAINRCGFSSQSSAHSRRYLADIISRRSQSYAHVCRTL